jgi:hypothetical protein
LPESITVTQSPDVHLSPNQMRALKAETGKTLEELMGAEADEADRMQAMIWLELRRQGHDARWDQVGDVYVEFVPEPPDPTRTDDSESSPPSAASGGSAPETSTP